MTLIKKIVISDANLPEQVFHEKFIKYFSFDNDICTSEDLINSTWAIINQSFGCDSVADVFSSTDFAYLGELYADDNWVSKLKDITTGLNNAGDYGALTIIEKNKRWALFQKTPVDKGVLGINSNESLEPIKNIIYDNFVDCDVLSKWLEQKTSQDIESVRSIGKEYLMRLVVNYS
ncbi:hypothetical protein [Kosakonia radicincitans]|uniref:hypothetical protein n=1 Tax=Kosakonia radicincitans TaxID=283686 RepID=UPI0005C2CA89|nr:hypothetical protein [Kosakonia radicincitans]KIS43356.1 hypothetical protein LG58_2018 [Kosakonia radicincitans YD4]